VTSTESSLINTIANRAIHEMDLSCSVQSVRDRVWISYRNGLILSLQELINADVGIFISMMTAVLRETKPKNSYGLLSVIFGIGVYVIGLFQHPFWTQIALFSCGSMILVYTCLRSLKQR
jgi:hypothetical protein